MKTWCCLAIVCAAILSGCAGSQAAPSPTASLATNPATTPSGVAVGALVSVQAGTMSVTGTHWPDFVAESKGFYQREGLKVQTTLMNADATVSSLVAGSIDISFASAAGFVYAVDQGAKLEVVGAGMDRAPYKFMSPPDIKSVGALKGKNVGAASAVEPYTLVIRDILKNGGLDPDKDVQFVYGSSSNQRMQALLGGAFQATLVTPPEDQELLNKGYNVLASTLDYYPNLQLSLVAVRKDWAEQHADVLRRYLKAAADASQWLNDPSNKQEAIDILAKATKAQPSSAAAAYDAFITKAHAFPNDACVQDAGMQKLIEVLQGEGQVHNLSSIPMSQYIDKQYCPREASPAG